MATKEEFDNWPGCRSCKHYEFRAKAPHYVCTAFPEGIPLTHKSGSVPHVSVGPHQDNEIVFESK